MSSCAFAQLLIGITAAFRLSIFPGRRSMFRTLRFIRGGWPGTRLWRFWRLRWTRRAGGARRLRWARRAGWARLRWARRAGWTRLRWARRTSRARRLRWTRRTNWWARRTNRRAGWSNWRTRRTNPRPHWRAGTKLRICHEVQR